MANDGSTGPGNGQAEEAVEGSWSPKRSGGGGKASSTKASGKASGKKDKDATPDTEVLAQEIEQTREELAETLDAIAEKVSPKRVVSRTKKAAKDGANDAVQAVKDTASSAAGAVKEKVSGDSDPVRSPLTPATSVEVGSASPLADDTVSIPGAEVPLEPAPTPGALADASYTVTEPAGSDLPSYTAPLPPATPSRTPVLAGAGAALLVLLLVMKRRRR